MTDAAAELRRLVVGVVGVPPIILGEERGPRPDPRCRCDHWGCRVGLWHCHGTMGACYVPEPRP